MKKPITSFLLLFVFFYSKQFARDSDSTIHAFKKIQITDEFWCEGVGCGDFNLDGNVDICGGPFWWEGPEFKLHHQFRSGADKISVSREVDGSKKTFRGFSGAKGNINEYSDNFLTYIADFDQDGYVDILVCDFPGKGTYWYENPEGKEGAGGQAYWNRHLAIDQLENESPVFGDITGDGRSEMICNLKGHLGYYRPDWANPTMPWTWHSISPKGPWHTFTHGIGFGDISGDGRADLLEQNGWWEQPSSLVGDPLWKQHEFPFAPGEGTAGAAQMLVLDFNGDGLNDVLTTLNPHSYGIVWYEQVRNNGKITFQQHLIIGEHLNDSKYSVRFSQAHALNITDIDEDGVRDFVTGKRFWAHGPEGDDEPDAPAVLYWFKTVRNSNQTVDFIPYLIDVDSGIGMQITTTDLNNDGLTDQVIGNKKGIFLFIHERKLVGGDEWKHAQPQQLNQ